MNSSSWQTGNNALLLYVVPIQAIAHEASPNIIFILSAITTIFIWEIDKKHHILFPLWNFVAFWKRDARLAKQQDKLGNGFGV
ncbi:hypothetical protein [Massilia niastensis]|uniref:hypothetical protein n=1 Tax=Massilia niastensis TaxID=544911 RepID=UPI0012EB8B9C|nr:hypothetical protein [Massilia niastensis]